MTVSLAAVSDATIERLLADPPLVWLVFAPDDPEAYERARAEAAHRAKPGFIARLFGARAPADQPPPTPLSLQDGEGELADIDKSWHGIHYLLTGSANETGAVLDFLVSGGRDVGDEEIGYGPARVYTSAETREVAKAFAAVTDDRLRARFAPNAMMEAQIYPEIWDRDPARDDTLGYLMENVTVLRNALDTATSHGHGLMVVLC